jgi:colicin import membrane protein
MSVQEAEVRGLTKAEVVSVRVAEYSAVAAVLADLKSKYALIKWDVTTAKGMIDARKARAEIRDWRTGLEKERKKIKEAVLERGRLIDSEAKRITAELIALEDPIDTLIKDEEGKKERERIAKEEAEKTRVANIQAKMDRYRNLIFITRGYTAEQLCELIVSVRDEPITLEEYQEFASSAELTRTQAVSEINKLYEEEVEKEKEKARIAREREELAKLRQEQEARERDAERIRMENEKIERAAREAEEARLKKIRDAEDNRLAAERMALERARIAQEKEQAARLKEEADRQTKIIAEAKERDRKAAEEKAEMDRQKAELLMRQKEQEEHTRLLSERRKKLAAERRDSHSKALQDILEMAENVSEYPNHQAVRAQIAFIAEASL